MGENGVPLNSYRFFYLSQERIGSDSLPWTCFEEYLKQRRLAE